MPRQNKDNTILHGRLCTSALAVSNHLRTELCSSWLQRNQVIDKLQRLTVSSDTVSTHLHPEDYRHPAAETIGFCVCVCQTQSFLGNLGWRLSQSHRVLRMTVK